MKNRFVLILILGFTSIGCNGQKEGEKTKQGEDLDTYILEYKPTKSVEGSDQKFIAANKILENTIQSYEERGRFIFADYWNIGVAFAKLEESDSLILKLFNKAIETDREGMCEYVEVMAGHGSVYEKRFAERYNSFKEECIKGRPEASFDMEQYIEENGLERSLVLQIKEIHENDIKYRIDANVDWSKQNKLDKENQRLIDSLYQKYGSYIGVDMVGEKYKSTMFYVIQHSDIKMMKSYLPIIVDAVKAKQMDVEGLKYLLDRIAAIENNHQFFGSQLNVPYADKEAIEKVKEKYNIE